VRRSAYIGLGLVLLGAALGILWKGMPSTPGTEAETKAVHGPSLTAPREAGLPRPSTPASPPPGALTLRGVVRDAQGPVAGAVVLATAVEPEETLSELPLEKSGVQGEPLWQYGRYDQAASLLMQRVAARQGDVLVLGRTVSAADGSFQLEGLAPGTSTLWAESERGAAVLRDVPAGRQDVALVLEPGRLAEGQVVDEDDNEPVEGVLVTAIHTSLGRFFDTATDADGIFRFAPLPPGSYWLVLAKQGWLTELRLLQSLQKGQAPIELQRPVGLVGHVLQGGTPAANATVRLTYDDQHWETRTNAQGRFSFEGLRGGDYAVLAMRDSELAQKRVPLTGVLPEDFTLELSPSGFIEGTVRDETGRPVVSIKVEASSRGGEAGSALTDESGHYRLGPLASNIYLLTVHQDPYLYAHSRQELRGGVVSQDFTLTKGVPVAGVVEDSEGKPVPQLRLALWKPGGQKAFILGRSAHPSPPVDSTETDAAGAFVLLARGPGPYELHTNEDTVRFAKLRVSAPSQDVRLVVDRGIRVAGQVVDEAGQPVEGAQLLYVEEASPEDSGRPVRADAQGQFLTQALTEGRYLLYAWSEGDGAVREVSARVEARRGSSEPVQLRFEPGRTWTGRVEDAAGRPLSGVRLSLFSTAKQGAPNAALEAAIDAASPSVSVLSGPDGRFAFRHLAHTDYTMELHKPGYTLMSATPEESYQPLSVRVDAGEGRFVLESDSPDPP
jgi:hypothetical protein